MTPAYRDWVDKAKAVTLDTVLSKRSIKLTERHGELVGPCPICGGDDRFAVHVKKGVFNCRGCGKGGGGAIDLVMFLDKANFEQAVETITGSPPPKEGKRSKGRGKKSNGARKSWSPVVARYVYRQADGTPYLQVCRTAAKGFFQNKWNGQMWVAGKPEGRKIPYRLSELQAAPLTAKIHITEGEKDADALARMNFVATTNSEGASNWTDDLNECFRDRHVYIHEDNDEQGRNRVQRIARALHPIAASVRIIRLPGLKHHGDVSDWLESDLSGARLVRECESTPLWDPSATPPPEEEKEEVCPPVELKKKQADVLIELASSVELFHDRDDVGYARFDVNGHKENWPIRSKGFKRWLVRGFHESTQSAPSSEGMQAALGVLEARAQFDAPEQEVHVRVAGRDNCIYIDLADRDWRAIEIDEDGWRVVENPPVYFRRSSGMKPLPEPVAGGSLNDDLKPLLNVKTDNEFVLNVAWLLAALRPTGPYPVEALAGEQGSAKSMRANFLRALVDPNSVPLRALPRSEHDVFIAARNSHVLPGEDPASDRPAAAQDRDRPRVRAREPLTQDNHRPS
jgi:CHC2 zinc finger